MRRRHVPSHPQNAAKVRDLSRTASAFTAETDCLLEGGGFEIPVPRPADDSLSKPLSRHAVLMVRIHSPPAKSLRTVGTAVRFRTSCRTSSNPTRTAGSRLCRRAGGAGRLDVGL